ncbi:phosphate-starvation-inducible protein PsiE [Actinobacillus genomosp. 1]|uniref:phosphate-starvation-inducible protein PsiE n=1 Tax=Actinobacillus genomosp. 1 TaxID=254839 RepID=UPI002442E081|nr:phosphate-starvation-inducible protein PsiE [Actinobacillus genomosp. 1]WGE34050.1 phosphate-starvation-inducible protein PsiE [Actinobacillus genomosp. 1]WGE36099.1 phosphate-starvation-inducible protein PsiE [Actinobacillus genomosp. 1]WGE91435.1 phosphate-starvation-inducible protein PsiE [Actinobacillus genomosp. 1]
MNISEKFPDTITKLLRTILSILLIILAIVLIIALVKVTYGLCVMIITSGATVPYALAEQIVMFFLYFGFLGLISQYFKSGYHFPLRYFIYAGITAMLRLIIVDHESATNTILFAGAILLMVIALCLVLYSDKLRNI